MAASPFNTLTDPILILQRPSNLPIQYLNGQNKQKAQVAAINYRNPLFEGFPVRGSLADRTPACFLHVALDFETLQRLQADLGFGLRWGTV